MRDVAAVAGSEGACAEHKTGFNDIAVVLHNSRYRTLTGKLQFRFLEGGEVDGRVFSRSVVEA